MRCLRTRPRLTVNLKGLNMVSEMCQLTLVKKNQFHVFRYPQGQESAMIQTLVEMAANPASPIDWFDAAVLSHQMGQRIVGDLKARLHERTGMRK